MNAKILQGEEIAKRIMEDLRDKVARKQLKLAVVQVGQNAVSETYIRKKKEAASELGIGFELYKFVQEISQTDLKSRIEAIGKDKTVSGMIVQLPLSKHLNQQEILDGIPLEKDVDVLSSASFGLFSLGRLPILPPTVRAVSLLLKETGMELKGKSIAVVGAGRLVGLPVALWCMQKGATVSVANKDTKDLSVVTRDADIIISGVGKKGLIIGAMVKRGAVVIDAGSSVEAGLMGGDVDFESVAKKAGFITPVPGGVGPITVACLLENLLTRSSGK
ncbi:MAG TPA: bifunctional 5,10-methylenetetrahydrofolate dehydrogenase/5,10-methenyltetrahydrofolate cyclohydrolase [Candidatus Paceibacterota bacterium]